MTTARKNSSRILQPYFRTIGTIVAALVLALVLPAPIAAARAHQDSGHHSSGSHHAGGSSSHQHSSHGHRSGDHPSHGHRAPSSKRSSDARRDAHGRIKRSARAKDDFKRAHPCPSTGRSSGACPGYVIDHVRPLKRGGADDPSNMQWQTTADAKTKDKWE